MAQAVTRSNAAARRLALWLLPLTCILALAACGKATETAVEKAIESGLEKDGQKAQVDLSGSAAKVTVTDASGQSSQIEVGGAKVTESDLGVPLYPGATPVENASSRARTPEGTMAMMQLRSKDPPERVAAFYREQLKSRAQGKTLADMSGGDGSTTLVLGDEGNQQGVQIHVGRSDDGSAIVITATRAAPR